MYTTSTIPSLEDGNTLVYIGLMMKVPQGKWSAGAIYCHSFQIDLLDVPQQVLTVAWDDLDADKKEMVYVVRGGIKALWSLSQCRKNKEAMRKAGIVKILARLLRCAHEDIISPTLGTIQQCATEVRIELVTRSSFLNQGLKAKEIHVLNWFRYTDL